MIIDFHTHAFPDAIAKTALERLRASAADIEPSTDGTISSLVTQAKKSGVDCCVVLNIATSPKQQQKVNDFAKESDDAHGGAIVSFGSVHPDAPDAIEELERIHAMGLKGVKFHPDYQKFFVDEERMLPIYEKIGELGLITVFHAGIDTGLFEPVHCTPKMLSAVLPRFNGSPVVAAHFGGHLLWYDVEKYLAGKDIFLDTGFCYAKMPHLHAKRIVQNHGAHRVLLGSDAPWSDARNEMKLIDSLQLSQAEHELILGGNAQKLLGM